MKNYEQYKRIIRFLTSVTIWQQKSVSTGLYGKHAFQRWREHLSSEREIGS